VDRYGAEGVDTLDELLAAGVDGVIIAASTNAHTSLVLSTVEAGLPTLCEKPVAPGGVEGAELLRRLAGHDVPVQIGFQRRFDAKWPIRSTEPGATYPGGQPHRFFMDRFQPAFRAEFETFLDVVAGKRPSPCTVADGLEADWIAEACARSAAEHRAVRIEEV